MESRTSRKKQLNDSPYTVSQKEYNAITNDPKYSCIRCKEILSTSVTLEWDEQKRLEKEIHHHEIKYKVKGEQKWSAVHTLTKSNSFKIEGLKSNTCYCFKVRAIFDDDEEGPFSEVLDRIETKQSLSATIARKELKVRDGQPSIFKLPFTIPKEHVSSKSSLRKIFLEHGQDCSTPVKTIVFVGESGSGKSLLIDGIVNYILDVEWDDKCRFTISDITYEKKKKIDQTRSQTELITCNTIHSIPGSRINYTLNIIDTPGFGNATGTEHDQAIIGRIRDFFRTAPPKGIQTLDAVCIVTQASTVRLTPQQRYIFHSVLSIFGKDISKNIFVLITFADGNEPPVQKALQAAEIPFEKSFKFNNSSLFASTDNAEEMSIGKMLWKMGKNNFRDFFIELQKTETKRIQFTAESLSKEKQLVTTIHRLQPPMQQGLNLMTTIQGELKVVEDRRQEILSGKMFEYKVDETSQTKKDLAAGKYVISCLTCNMTCFDHNTFRRNKDRTSTASCTECPKKCFFSNHYKGSYKYELFSKPIKRTSEDLMKKYDIPRDKQRDHSTVSKKVTERLNHVSKIVFSLIDCVRNCVNELQQEANKDNLMSQEEYIEILISAEVKRDTCGSTKRVKTLKAFKERDVSSIEVLTQEFRPWTQDEVDALLLEYEYYETGQDLRSCNPTTTNMEGTNLSMNRKR